MSVQKPKPGFVRELCDKAEQLGFRFDGYNGNNHPRFYNEARNIHYTTSCTPSDWRSVRNAIAEMERLSGRKLPRQNAGKFRHVRTTQLVTGKSDREREVAGEVESLVAESQKLARRWDEIVNTVAHSRRDSIPLRREAEKVARKYGHIRTTLASEFYRVIPPITGGE